MSDNVPALIVSKPEIEKIKNPSKKDVLDALVNLEYEREMREFNEKKEAVREATQACTDESAKLAKEFLCENVGKLSLTSISVAFQSMFEYDSAAEIRITCKEKAFTENLKKIQEKESEARKDFNWGGEPVLRDVRERVKKALKENTPGIAAILESDKAMRELSDNLSEIFAKNKEEK